MSLWSEKADAELKTLVDTHGKNWDTISTLLSETRTARGCEARWTKLTSGKVRPRASKAASAAPSSKLSDSGQESEHEDDVSLASASARYAGAVELPHDPVEVAPLPAEQPKSNKKRASSTPKDDHSVLLEKLAEAQRCVARLTAENQQLKLDLQAAREQALIFRTQRDSAAEIQNALTLSNNRLIDTLGTAARGGALM